MTVIDFHTHILPSSFKRDRSILLNKDATFGALFDGSVASMATAEELVAAMDEDGVDVSVALGYGWCDQGMAIEANDYLIEAATRHKGRILPFCSVNPLWGDDALKEVERCVDLGAVGIGELHPTTQQFDLTSTPGLDPIMELARHRQLPVVVHASEPIGHNYSGKGTTTTQELFGFIQNYPENKVVAAHWGGGLPFYGLMPEVRKSLSNTYFDTAASPFLYSATVFPVCVQTVGASQVLFGSDYPLLRAGRVLREACEALAQNPNALEAVLYRNAIKLCQPI